MATHSSVFAWRIPGMGSLVGFHLWCCAESDMSEVTQQQQHIYLYYIYVYIYINTHTHIYTHTHIFFGLILIGLFFFWPLAAKNPNIDRELTARTERGNRGNGGRMDALSKLGLWMKKQLYCCLTHTYFPMTFNLMFSEVVVCLFLKREFPKYFFIRACRYSKKYQGRFLLFLVY